MLKLGICFLLILSCCKAADKDPFNFDALIDEVYAVAKEGEHVIKTYLKTMYQAVVDHNLKDFKSGSVLYESLYAEVHPMIKSRDSVFKEGQKKVDEVKTLFDEAIRKAAKTLNKNGSKFDLTTTGKAATAEIQDGYTKGVTKATKLVSDTEKLLTDMKAQKDKSAPELKKLMVGYLSENSDKILKYTHLDGGLKSVAKENTNAIKDMINIELEGKDNKKEEKVKEKEKKEDKEEEEDEEKKEKESDEIEDSDEEKEEEEKKEKKDKKKEEEDEEDDDNKDENKDDDDSDGPLKDYDSSDDDIIKPKDPNHVKKDQIEPQKGDKKKSSVDTLTDKILGKDKDKEEKGKTKSGKRLFEEFFK